MNFKGPDSRSLTPKQKQVLDFILEFTRDHDYAPSQAEIAQKFGFKSLGSVQHYMNELESRGLLEKEWNARRGVKVVGSKETTLPLLGKVAAGRPIEAIPNVSRIDVPASMIARRGDYFALEVKGDSMKDDGILDGDYVVIKKQSTAENGQTVVALIDNEATIKKYFAKKGRVELHPSNPKYQPIVVDGDHDLKIQGIFVGLIRQLG